MAQAAPLFAGTMVAGSLLSAGGQFAQGSIARQEAKTQASLVGLQAKQKEMARTKRLNEALASQIVSAGARGITMEGSPFQTAQADIREAQQAQDAEDIGTRINQRMLRSRGRQAMIQGRLGALSSLITDSSQAALMAV